MGVYLVLAHPAMVMIGVLVVRSAVGIHRSSLAIVRRQHREPAWRQFDTHPFYDRIFVRKIEGSKLPGESLQIREQIFLGGIHRTYRRSTLGIFAAQIEKPPRGE